nr:protoporphyrinogen IX oxidase-like [Nerophis lumbriciformis]
MCWMAAIFYLPRLFVYHASAEDAVGRERFNVMERKLYRGIATPSMVASVLFGGLLVFTNPDYLKQGWFHIKMAMVALLFIYHGFCYYYLKQFQKERCRRSPVFFRWFNEAPVLLLIGIVIMAVVRP